ncbi:ABC transporter substrate-binding protein [Chryseosolibacter indicus]|uniref:Tetratricopeptide repeat protein n=1 Tax=Chryseosolibacter indicus TaxID=2782351 RepID=A0ABS5VU38_9BACT|nr:ABC transporter substrate-binding protein [Chryseosolibacter indicus]MBT1704938.1 tetratricopeptide repeat protein [Chryseosolibacter indicus]
MRNLLFVVLFSSSFTVLAQTDYNRLYSNAKDLYKQGKYNLAMESFKPLVIYDQNNPYSEYASFYYAVSAYNQGYKAVAKDAFNQIKKQNSRWDKINEVNFWLAKIHFDNGDYFQGLKTLQAIEDKKFEKDISALKAQAVSKITDVETLRMMQEEYGKDEIIGKQFAEVLAKNVTSAEDKKLLESLINKYNLKRSEYLPEAPKTFHKDRYAVAVLFPFNVSSLDPTPSKKRNQILLDYYEGVKLAVDTLNRQGVNISLRAYDTERNTDRIKRLLATDELKNTDLIFGPFYPEENKIVQEFSIANRVNTVHPFSNSTDMIENNPHAYLFQPSSENLGRKSAEFLAGRTRRKSCMIFYGVGKKDSVLAANFAAKATEKGLRVVLKKKVPREDVGKILDILATPTEFDEFKYPTQFTLKKDSIGGIYVASDDALIYAKVVSSIETRGDSIRVIGSENWIDDNTIDLEKYQTLHITLTAPNFADPSKPKYIDFFNKFTRRYGRTPSAFARMGFESMMLFGKQLKENGVFFQEGLSKSGNIPGYLTEGFNYEYSRDNSLIPFISFDQGRFKVVEKK